MNKKQKTFQTKMKSNQNENKKAKLQGPDRQISVEA